MDILKYRTTHNVGYANHVISKRPFYVIRPKMPLNAHNAISRTATNMFAIRIKADFATPTARLIDTLSMRFKASLISNRPARADFACSELSGPDGTFRYRPRAFQIPSMGPATLTRDSSGFTSDNEFIELI